MLIISSLRMSDFKLDLASDCGVLAKWLQPVLSLMRIIFTNLEAVFSTSKGEGEFLGYDDDDYNDFNYAHDDDQDTIMMIMMVTMLMSMMIMSLMMMIIMNTMIMNDDDNDDDLDVDDDDDAHDDDNDDENYVDDDNDDHDDDVDDDDDDDHDVDDHDDNDDDHDGDNDGDNEDYDDDDNDDDDNDDDDNDDDDAPQVPRTHPRPGHRPRVPAPRQGLADRSPPPLQSAAPLQCCRGLHAPHCSAIFCRRHPQPAGGGLNRSGPGPLLLVRGKGEYFVEREEKCVFSRVSTGT